MCRVNLRSEQMQKLQYGKTKLFASILPTLIWCSIFSPFMQAQTKISKKRAVSEPISICDLLNNKKRYDKKEVKVKAVWEIQAETSSFQKEDGCKVFEGATVSEDERFESVNDETILKKYKEAQNLFEDAASQSSLPFYNWVWNHTLQIELVTNGYFYMSNKKKYGHLDEYKNMFLLTKIEKILSAKVVDSNGKTVKEKNF